MANHVDLETDFDFDDSQQQLSLTNSTTTTTTTKTNSNFANNSASINVGASTSSSSPATLILKRNNNGNFIDNNNENDSKNISSSNVINNRLSTSEMAPPLSCNHHTSAFLIKNDDCLISTNITANNVQEWTVKHVAEWLRSINLDSYVKLFCDQHRIDGSVLLSLTVEDLRSEPLKLTVLGDIKRLCLAIDHLKSINNSNNNQQQRKKNYQTGFQQQQYNSHYNNRHRSHYQQDQINHNNNNIDKSSCDGLLYVDAHCDESTLNDGYNPCITDPESEMETYDTNLPSEDIVQLSSNCSTTSTSSMVSNNSFGSNDNGIFSRNNNSRSNMSLMVQPKIKPIIIPRSELSQLMESTHVSMNLRGDQNATGQQTLLTKNRKPFSSHPNSNNVKFNNNKSIQQYPHTNNMSGHPRIHHRSGNHNKFRPEVGKAIVAMLYFFTSTFVTAIIMVIVHDRVPDMDTYPPLPDIILDNLPLIPWAFMVTEACGLVLLFIWALILIFHKHRFILIRRMFSLFGSVFLIRCFTMVITSLSVPGRHLQCKARPYGTWSERLYQAYLIMQGGGMALKGVRSCGDYMFSGHTVVLTMLNFFITEYTPTVLSSIHTMSWVLNLFGVFFILAAHEHYSIDVFIAFYISTRLFLYYHTLANNRVLSQQDGQRTRVWFPLFSFFESGVDGIVPNEYEIPFKRQFDRLINHLVDRMSKISWLRIGFLEDEWNDDDCNNYYINDQNSCDNNNQHHHSHSSATGSMINSTTNNTITPSTTTTHHHHNNNQNMSKLKTH